MDFYDQITEQPVSELAQAQFKPAIPRNNVASCAS